MQYGKLLEKSGNCMSEDLKSIDPSLIYELALFGVSHYAPLLLTFDFRSVEGLSRISENDLEKVSKIKTTFNNVLNVFDLLF